MIHLGKNSTDKLLVGLLLFIGSKGNLIAISDVMLVLALVYSLIIFKIRGLLFSKNFALFTAFYLLITFVFYIKFGWINPTSSIRLYLKMLLGYTVISTVGWKLLLYFERFIYILAAISLPLYAFQLLNYDGLKSIIGLFESMIPALDYRGDWYVNSFFFTLNDNAIFRNSGFAWEPKGFANLLGLAIILNVMRERFKINKQLIILSIALVTTLSTAGYLIVCIALPLIYLATIESREKKILAITLGSVVVVAILSLDFMYSKITNEIENREAHLIYIDAETDLPSVTLGRFGSMALAIKDLPENPIFGIGMQDSERTQGRKTRLVWVSGLADYLSRFGIFGMVVLTWMYTKSSREISAYYSIDAGLPLLLAFMIIFFASAVVLTPLFFAFQFICISNLPKEQSKFNEK